MMQSAYARSGKAPMYQIFVLGLGMDRTACAQPAVTTLSPSRPVSFSFLRSACDRPYANSGLPRPHYLWLALVIIALSDSGVKLAMSTGFPLISMVGV